MGHRRTILKTARRLCSILVGWLADRWVPRPLRGLVYGAYCRLTGADPSEAELAVDAYPSLGAFFVRRLRPGARPLGREMGSLLSPCDGTVQAMGRIERGTLLQAKGQTYGLEELLGAPPGQGLEEELEDAWTVTIYLSPRDYHRVHAPLEARLEEVLWLPGDRRSVAPGVLSKVPKVLSTNERAVLRLRAESGPAWLVMVGALNVGRIRVVGVEPESSPASPIFLPCGSELARFEMGSTVVLVVPGMRSVAGLRPGSVLRMGQRIAERP